VTCECCQLAANMPELTRRSYSMGCVWCAARYVAHGGEHDIARWVVYGVDAKEATTLRLNGEFHEPDLKQRKVKK
jgi:hypothetical protein